MFSELFTDQIEIYMNTLKLICITSKVLTPDCSRHVYFCMRY